MGLFAQMGYCTVYPEAAGGGGELPCKKLDNARWKIGIKSLKETNLGTMVQALFVRPDSKHLDFSTWETPQTNPAPT